MVLKDKKEIVVKQEKPAAQPPAIKTEPPLQTSTAPEFSRCKRWLFNVWTESASDEEKMKENEDYNDNNSKNELTPSILPQGLSSSSFALKDESSNASSSLYDEVNENVRKKKRATTEDNRIEASFYKRNGEFNNEAAGERTGGTCIGVFRACDKGKWYWRARWSKNGKSISGTNFYEYHWGADVAKSKAIDQRCAQEALGAGTQQNKTGIKYLIERDIDWRAQTMFNSKRWNVYFNKKEFGNEKARKLATMASYWLQQHPKPELSPQEVKDLIIKQYEEEETLIIIDN